MALQSLSGPGEGGLHHSPPPPLLLAPAPTGSPAPLHTVALSESGGRWGSGFFRLAASALSPSSRVAVQVGQAAGRQLAGRKKGVPGGAGALQMLLSSPRQLATFLLFFPGDATPPEDTGDIGFC